MAVNFSDIEYKRPDYDAVQQSLNEFTEKIKNAESYRDLRNTIIEYNKMKAETELQYNIATIRSFLDSSDTFYAEELQANSRGMALLDDAPYLDALVSTPFSSELEEEFSPAYLNFQRDKLRLTANAKELQAKHSELINNYQQLKANIRVKFRGKELSEGQMTRYAESTDRETRREAWASIHKAFADKEETFCKLLSELVDVRIAIAKENGFDSFMDYMNLDMGRRSYSQKELLEFCRQVRLQMVPLMRKLTILQAERLGLDRLTVMDERCCFPDGNPTPSGDADFIISSARKMFENLGDDIGKLFSEMADGGFINIGSSPNKISGMAFCTALTALQMPYIFGACNGAYHDVTNLTHEMGHAYQLWLCMKLHPMPEHIELANDLIEIPSKAMEQFTCSYAEMFFGEDADKFCFHFMQYTVEEICSFCATHEYESWLYANPDASSRERIEQFNDIMAQYNPEIDYAPGEEFLSRGSALFRNMGVFMFPAYVISYALTDMGALELREKAQKNFRDAWRDYNSLCKAGNTGEYSELLSRAGLHPAYTSDAVSCGVSVISRELGIVV